MILHPKNKLDFRIMHSLLHTLLDSVYPNESSHYEVGAVQSPHRVSFSSDMIKGKSRTHPQACLAANSNILTIYRSSLDPLKFTTHESTSTYICIVSTSLVFCSWNSKIQQANVIKLMDLENQPFRCLSVKRGKDDWTSGINMLQDQRERL